MLPGRKDIHSLVFGIRKLQIAYNIAKQTQLATDSGDSIIVERTEVVFAVVVEELDTVSPQKAILAST